MLRTFGNVAADVLLVGGFTGFCYSRLVDGTPRAMPYDDETKGLFYRKYLARVQSPVFVKASANLSGHADNALFRALQKSVQLGATKFLISGEHTETAKAAKKYLMGLDVLEENIRISCDDDAEDISATKFAKYAVFINDSEKYDTRVGEAARAWTFDRLIYWNPTPEELEKAKTNALWASI